MKLPNHTVSLITQREFKLETGIQNETIYVLKIFILLQYVRFES